MDRRADGDRVPSCVRQFDLDKPVKRARLHISGLGWYELYLNGQRVGDHLLDPATSDYAKRVLYVTYDVTELLQSGANAVGVMLGNAGLANPDGSTKYGDSPRLRLQLNLEFADGSMADVTSGEGWENGRRPDYAQRSLWRRNLRRPPRATGLGIGQL